MAYNPKPIHTPPITGARLEFVAWALEHQFPGAILSRSIFSALGVDTFREKTVPHPPLHTPLHPHPDGEKKAGLAPLPQLKIKKTIQTTIRPNESYQFPSVLDYATAYKEGTLTPLEVANRIIRVLEKQDRGNPPLYAFISWNRDFILQQARESSERIAAGKPRSVFEGVPVGIKDEIDVAGFCTTLGTSFKNQEIVQKDAFVVSRLREAGAIILGKTNMHEIGIGVTGLNPFHGTPVNPYSPWRYPGGSSSGSASAVASGICPIALGADGGGSVRIPAAYCGIYGLKPTWGRTSSSGEYLLGHSVGNIGQMGGNVRDLALTYLVTSGTDPEDPATHIGPVPNLDGFMDSVKGLKIGVYKPWFEHGRPDVVNTAWTLIEKLKTEGAEIIDIEIRGVDLLRIAHMITISSEMRSSMNREVAQRKSDFGNETRSSLALARYLEINDYIQAQKVRGLLDKRLSAIFTQVDLIATPTTANLPPRLHKDRLLSGVSDMGSMSETMRFAILANMLGNPAITVPAGFITAKSKLFWKTHEERDEDGEIYSQVPVGLQFIGKHWDEALLLRTARVCEEMVIRPRPRVYLSPYEPDNPFISGWNKNIQD